MRGWIGCKDKGKRRMMRWSLATLVVTALVFAVLLGRQAETPGWLPPALAVAFLAGVAFGWLRHHLRRRAD